MNLFCLVNGNLAHREGFAQMALQQLRISQVGACVQQFVDSANLFSDCKRRLKRSGGFKKVPLILQSQTLDVQHMGAGCPILLGQILHRALNKF